MRFSMIVATAVRLSVVVLFLLAAATCAVPLDRLNGDRPTAPLVIHATPDSAKVYLDGHYIGQASRFDGKNGTLHVTGGGHVLRFEADDYENERVDIMAETEERIITVRMIPRPKPSSGKD